MTTSLIVAAARNDVIGADGALPWHLPDDLRRFRRLTHGRPVVAGRVTHESILARLGRPLPGRTSVVLSSARHQGAGAGGRAGDGVVWVTSLEEGMTVARAAAAGAGHDEVFVIGGTSVYRQALPLADRIYLTRLHQDVAGDTVMPPGWLDGFRETAREDREDPAAGTAYSWLDYERESA